MKQIVGIALAVAAVVILIMAVVVAFPGLFPPLRSLILDRVGWVQGEAGSPEDAYDYAKGKIPVPSLRTEVEPSGSSVQIRIESDGDCTISATIDGPLGEQKLADGVVRRFRTSLRELPDGKYQAYFLARRCVGLSGKPAEYDDEACQESSRTEDFVIDTKPPEPGEIEIQLEGKVVIITGSATDLAGLNRACVGKVCVDAKGGNFKLQVPLKVVNKHLRKQAAIIVTLTDAKGNQGEAKTYLEKPTENWILVDENDRLRTIGHDDGGLGGNPPAWTVELLEDGQALEAFGTTPIWYWGVRVAPFMVFLLAIISWRGRTTLIGWFAGLLEWLADRLEGAPVAAEES